MRKISLTLIAIFIIVSCYAQAYIDELNGSTLGNSKGITYTNTTQPVN